jgi:hexosaminidase
VAAIFTSCKESIPTNLAAESLIPKPVSVTATGKSFELTFETEIVVDEAHKALGDSLALATGFTFKSAAEGSPESGVYLKLDSAETDLGAEGYELTIETEQVTIKAL